MSKRISYIFEKVTGILLMEKKRLEIKRNKPKVCEDVTFEQIFFEHSESLRNYLYYKCGDMDKCEDIVQESFKALWENCHKIEPSKAKSWLFTVATNKLYNEADKEKVRLNFINQSEKKSNYETPQFKLEYDEYAQKLDNAINDLPDKQREAFLMHRIDKLSYKEIAEYLGISVKAVEKRISQALKKLNANIFKNH